MSLLDKARNIFIFIVFFVIFILFGVYLNAGFQQYKEMTNRLDSMDENITSIKEEINNIKKTASDTDAKINDFENTLIDKIDVEIDEYMAELEEIAEIEAVEEETVNQSNQNYSYDTTAEGQLEDCNKGE